MKLKNYTLFIIVSLLTFLSTLLQKYFFDFDKLIYDSYSNILVEEQLNEILISQKKWSWVGYFVIPLLILFRATLVSVCLSIGVFFYDMENKIKFNQIFKITLKGEYILVLVGFVKIIYFSFIKPNYTLLDIQLFYPLSYTNFLNLGTIKPWLIYPLQTINLFEILYFFILVFYLHKLIKNKYWKSFEIVSISYGSGLIIWLVLVTFLTLNLS